jgi:hypothetical protein
MSKKPATDILVTPDEIQAVVHVVRGQRVMLDFDLARLYGVTTGWHALPKALRIAQPRAKPGEFVVSRWFLRPNGPMDLLAIGWAVGPQTKGHGRPLPQGRALGWEIGWAFGPCIADAPSLDRKRGQNDFS